MSGQGSPAGRTDTGPRAALFDLDGVITRAVHMHAAVWKQVFDEYLRSREARSGAPFHPFNADLKAGTDYRAWVDGRSRYDGVRTFLTSRGIKLPEGKRSDPPDAETAHGLGNRKDRLFREWLSHSRVEADPAAIRLIRELRAAGVKVALATASNNASSILERAGMPDDFDARLNESLSERHGLEGKPQPDLLLKCLELLETPDAARAVAFDDSIVGMAAARTGGFGLIVGVDRGDMAGALREHGADAVVGGLEEVSFEWIARRLDQKRRAQIS